MPPERNLILAIGGEPFAQEPFEERGMLVDHTKTPKEAAVLFGHARAVVISERNGDIAKYKKHFYEILTAAEQHGLALVVLVTESDLEKVTLLKVEIIRELNTCGTVEIYSISQLKEAAENIRSAFLNPLQKCIPTIDPIALKDKEMEVLLRRSFYDCSRIRLEQIFGGKASTGVFIVHAWCAAGNVGTRPLPFFVKFGKPTSIERERQNYKTHAELYVPFSLRPNLDRRRCVRGSKFSALIGNFVEDAMPLREALRKGLGDGVLFSLFETSLKAFRSQAFAGNAAKRWTGLEAFLQERINGRKGDRTIETAKDGKAILALTEQLDKAVDPSRLAFRLLAVAKSIPFWWVPIHGDLHSGNVMVRRADAILIDFGSVAEGPLTADPATLEVSLVFGTDEHDVSDSFDEWKSFVDSAYACAPGIRPPNPALEPTKFDWLRQSIRELRHILFGCDCHEAEAELVLAAYLMRFASLEIEELKDAALRELALKRHAYALIVAERLVSEVEKVGK